MLGSLRVQFHLLQCRCKIKQLSGKNWERKKRLFLWMMCIDFIATGQSYLGQVTRVLPRGEKVPKGMG